MTVLIVEDEPGPREGLYRLLKESSPNWQLLPPCTNGVEGLEAIEAHRPNLVISDIRMPDLDGLAMLSAMRKAGGSASIIVLSGYADFEYARKCLSLGVREYLVKPVTAPVILQAVRSVEESHTRDEALADWLEGRSPSLGSGILFLFRLGVPLTADRRRILNREIVQLCAHTGGVLWWELPASGELFFWLRGAPVLPKAGQHRFLDTLSQRLHGPVVGAASILEGSGVELAATLRRHLKRYLCEPAPGFSWCGSEEEEREVPYPLALEREGLTAIQTRKTGAVSGVLGRLRAEVFRPGFDPESGLAVVRRFFFSLQNHLKDLDPGRFAVLQAWDPATRLEGALDAPQLKQVFDQTATLLETEVSGASRETDNLKIQSALTLVASRLTNPPSLAECADELGFSAEYLSRLFKAQMGVGYARYVMTKRIDLAKALLTDPQRTVLQISESLGFGNPKYFGAVFRKETGFTPSEYRERF